MSRKTAVYAAFHAPAPVIDADFVVPIHVGRARAAAPLDGMIGDDTGDNISARNPAYCELTALYWAWKNDRTSARIGLMHYRRMLDMAGTAEGAQAELFVPRFDARDWAARTSDWLAEHGDDWDVILPRRHTMGRTVETNYRRGHAPADFDRLRAVIAEFHPAHLDAFEAEAAHRRIYLGNIFLMRRDIFDGYCEWLFDILERVAVTDLQRTHYSPTQARYLGFLAERLLGVYMRYLRARRPNLRVREVHIINTSNALFNPYVSDDRCNGPEDVNIAFSADRAYLPHTAAMLQSVLSRADPARRINLFFLHSDIAPVDLELLGEVVAIHPRATLHPINAGETFGGAYRSASRAPSNATYNRFLLFDLLPGLDRLLYLDVDMIALDDVCALFDTDMGGAALGAVTDHIMTRTLTGATPTVDPEVPDLRTYHREVLGLSDDQIARYFNAGLLLFDFTRMDVAATGRTLFAAAEKGRYLFRDQDILNMHFKDDLHVLPDEWNVFNTIRAGYNRVPAPNHRRAMQARSAPRLVHYAAGDYKPWNRVAVPMAQHYWAAIMQTPFYAEVLARQRVQTAPGRRGSVVETGRKLAERFPVLKPVLLRVHAALRDRQR
ncbi:DUF4422 domain-containing protein [Jannaschia sp. S6380]|uniref:DUF4422 domain-containing protein n=1 Tax=Jannaschia sp. S6380 TaxID=2926408 RepID=UPI001FF30B49|nr:DUF4422 domain-containing protein [Jannaschia sp. S6380]MCK0168323.1 DUF4422 domain-containing protein [Jannaschia sp. S6380]